MLYAHVWSFVLGCPPLVVAPHVDVNRLLALFGTGVDLFFVISGFVMYLMYGGKQSRFEWPEFAAFVAKRFRRIAPAFYVAVLFSALLLALRERRFPLTDVLAHVAFASTLVPGPSKLATSFWSLATEWHFYLLLPVLVHFVARTGFRATFWATMLLAIASRCVVTLVGGEAGGIDLDHLIPSRFVEFGWGILAARMYMQGVPAPRIFRGSAGFALAWAVSLVGRLMMTDSAARVPHAGPWIQALSIIVLSFGYMLVVWNVVSGPSKVTAVLSSFPMQWVGKVSYSLYLWHWDIGLTSIAWLAGKFGKGAWTPIGYTALSLLVLLPISALSYRWLEAPYFRTKALRTAP